MSAHWYYLKPRWLLGYKTVGPVSEHDLLHQIDDGRIKPDTMLRSSKTKDKWVRMSTVNAAMDRWRLKHPDPSSDATPTQRHAGPESQTKASRH